MLYRSIQNCVCRIRVFVSEILSRSDYSPKLVKAIEKINFGEFEQIGLVEIQNLKVLFNEHALELGCCFEKRTKVVLS